MPCAVVPAKTDRYCSGLRNNLVVEGSHVGQIEARVRVKTGARESTLSALIFPDLIFQILINLENAKVW